MPLAAVKAAPEYAYRSSTSVCPADRAANMLSLQFAHPRLFTVLALDIAYLIGLKVLFMHILTWAPPTGGYTQACREVDRLYGSVLYNVNPIYRQEAHRFSHRLAENNRCTAASSVSVFPCR